MGAVFFLLITSIGLIMRFLGKDLLKINKNKTISTYWIDRDKPKKTTQNKSPKLLFDEILNGTFFITLVLHQISWKVRCMYKG